WESGARLVAGVDEVGRGSLFGCVVAGAVILDPTYRIRGLRDSKLLLPDRREVLAQRIREHCIAWAVAAVDAARIDQINIYHASRAAMRDAVLRLCPAADHLLVDAVRSIAICRKSLLFTATRFPHPSRPRPFWPRWSAIASCGSGTRYFRPTAWLRTRGIARPSTWQPCGNWVRRHYTGSRSRQCGRTRCPRRHSPSWTMTLRNFMPMRMLSRKTLPAEASLNRGRSVPAGTF